jgi:hypothetical protein
MHRLLAVAGCAALGLSLATGCGSSTRTRSVATTEVEGIPSDHDGPLIAVPIPNVVGLSELAALATLRAVDLSPYVVRQASLRVRAGVVVAQIPVAGNGVDPDSNIAITVSTG